MATYTNQVPTSLNVGDVLSFTKNGNYTLPRGQYKAEVASAKGGEGGRGYAWASLYGYTAGSSYVFWGPRTRGGGDGGAGGNGIAAVFQLALPEIQNAIRVSTGAVGASGVMGEIDWIASGTAYGTGGSAGTDAALTVNGSLVARTKGGGGGGGGSVTASLGGPYPTRDGQIVTRNVSGSNGRAGATGTIELAPAGYTTAVNDGNGYIRFTVLSLNAPPTKPEPITYGTPMSGRELELNCAPSTDPDPGDTVKYIWECKTDVSPWTQVATTDTNAATVTAPTAGKNVTYRVKAEDNHGAQSDYATGSPKVIVYNYPPTISGADEDRGEIRDLFAYAFSVDDRDPQDVLTVTVYLDTPARQLERIENAVRNRQYSVDLTPIVDFVSTERHTLVIHAADDNGGEAYRKIAFTRHSNKLEVELENPIKTTELVTTLLPMINYAAGKDYIFTCRVKNDPAAAWEDVTAFNHAGQIYEFVNDQKSTAADCEFYCYVSIEKGPSKHPIEFRGGTFICNANGIEVSYLKGTRIAPSDLSSGGYLGSDVTNGLQAVDQLSLAVAELVAGGGDDHRNNQSMVPVIKSNKIGTVQEGWEIPDPTVWSDDRVCAVVADSPANGVGLTILANPVYHTPPSNYPVRYVFLPAGWEEPKANAANEAIMAPVDGIFAVGVAASNVPVGTAVYAEESFYYIPGGDVPLINPNYGKLTLTNTGWQVGVIVAPGWMKLTVNEDPNAGALSIEYGNNANGYYAKFSTGLLICYKRQFALAAANTAYNWSYPYAFNSAGGVPVISMTSSTNTNASILKSTVANYSYATVMSNLATTYADMIAIGRWR